MDGEQYTDFNELYDHHINDFICKTWWMRSKEQLSKITGREKYLTTTYVPEHIALGDMSCLASKGFAAFQIAKYYGNLTPNAVREICSINGIRLTEYKSETLFEQQGSPFRMFDGTGTIVWYMNKAGMSLKDLSNKSGVSPKELYYIIAEIKIPTKDILLKLSDAMKYEVSLDVWRKIDKDVDAILSDSLPASCTRYVECIANRTNDELGEWGKTKQVVCLSHMVSHRIKNGYSVQRLAKMLNCYSCELVDWELCRKPMSIDIARKLVFIFRLKNYENLYICDKVPVNYYHYLWRYYLYGQQK